MYESDLTFQIPTDVKSTHAIMSMAYDMSQPFTEEDKKLYIDGSIPEGTLNSIIMRQIKYMASSTAFVLGNVHGRECNLIIIRTQFGGKTAHHIDKRWKNHSPQQLLTLAYHFAIIAPLRKIIHN